MENLAFEQLKQELKEHKLRPIYLLVGPEVFLRNQALALLKSVTVSPDALAFDYSEFSGKSAAGRDIVDAANTFPMMSPARLVLVTELESLAAGEHGYLAEYLSRPAAKSVLVLVAGEIDGRTALGKALKSNAYVLEFPQLKGFALRNWAEQQIRRRGYRMSAAALDRFLDLAGSDVLSLSNELEKLFLYMGEQKQIPDSAVDLLVPSSRQHSVFDLTGAVGRRDRRTAIRLLDNLLQTGEPPLVIVAMLARHMRQLLIAREMVDEGRDQRAIGAAAQVSPYFVQDLIRQARATDVGFARDMYVRVAELDRSLKSSAVDAKLILERFIHSL